MAKNAPRDKCNLLCVGQTISSLSHIPAHLQRWLLRGGIRRLSRMEADLLVQWFIRNLYEFEINTLHLREDCSQGRT